MPPFHPQALVAQRVTRRNQRVVIALTGVLDPKEDGPGDAAVEAVAGLEVQFPVDGVVVGHGEVLGRVGGVERPEVDDLAAVGVGDFDGLVFFEEEGGAAAGGEGLGGGHGF